MELGIKLPHSAITNHYENTPTIQLINKEASKMQNNIRQVDINNYWLRHEVASGVIREDQRKEWAKSMEQLEMVERK